MPNEFSVRLVPAKMAGVVSPRGGETIKLHHAGTQARSVVLGELPEPGD